MIDLGVSTKLSKNADVKHDLLLDGLKGFTILLVVLGHSVQAFVPGGEYDSSIIFRVIYSFHMPLFMFLSGAASVYSTRKLGIKYVYNKFQTLVVPFICWYLISFFLSEAFRTVSFGEFSSRVLVHPDYGLWFLWTLFLNFCCFVVIRRLERIIGLLSYFLVWFVVYIIPTAKFGIGSVKWYLPFFLAGYLIYRYRGCFARAIYNGWLILISLFPLLSGTWNRTTLPSHIKGIGPRLSAYNLNPIQLGEIMYIRTYDILVLFYTYLVAFSGIAFSYVVIHMSKRYKIGSVLSWLGLYTLDIYVSHLYFLRFGVGSGWIKVATGSLIALVSSLLLGRYVLRRFRVLNKLFLGGRN